MNFFRSQENQVAAQMNMEASFTYQPTKFQDSVLSGILDKVSAMKFQPILGQGGYAVSNTPLAR